MAQARQTLFISPDFSKYAPISILQTSVMPRPLMCFSSFEEYRWVGKALLHAFDGVSLKSADEHLRCDLELFVFCWAALLASIDLLSKNFPAAPNAAILGERMAEHRVAAARSAIRRQLKEEETRQQEREAAAKTTKPPQGSAYLLWNRYLTITLSLRA